MVEGAGYQGYVGPAEMRNCHMFYGTSEGGNSCTPNSVSFIRCYRRDGIQVVLLETQGGAPALLGVQRGLRDEQEAEPGRRVTDGSLFLAEVLLGGTSWPPIKV